MLIFLQILHICLIIRKCNHILINIRGVYTKTIFWFDTRYFFNHFNSFYTVQCTEYKKELSKNRTEHKSISCKCDWRIIWRCFVNILLLCVFACFTSWHFITQSLYKLHHYFKVIRSTRTFENKLSINKL